MPRLLPRLVRTVQLGSNLDRFYPFELKIHRPRRPKSIYKPHILTPSFRPDVYPQSILLTENNPIANPKEYVRHKSLPPRIYVPKDAHNREGGYDQPRQMTEEERKWWSSPYLRMLATPPRICCLSGRLLPSAFLLRLAPVRADDSPPASTKTPVPCILVPDGLQHPKFTSRRSNRSVHVLCSHQSISLILENARVDHIPYYVTIPPNLSAQVSHLLRLRVLQELDLIVAQFRAKPKAEILANFPIRRLSESEWNDIQERNQIPWPDAVAVINIPPIPGDSEPGRDLELSLSAFPSPPDLTMAASTAREVATMCSVSLQPSFPTNFQYRDVLPSAKVPLYNALALFPHTAHRTALCELLGRIQSMYDIAQRNNGLPGSGPPESNAYLLRSNSEIIKLGDMAAVATALWRVYLYERNVIREPKVEPS